MKKKLITTAVIVVGCAVLLAVFNPFTVVDAGHTGVVVNLGAVSDKTFTEGFHFKVPVIQTVKQVDNRIQKLEVDTASASKDLQTVKSKIAVNFRVKPEQSAYLYKNVGIRYEETIISPATQEIIKAVTARYTAEQLITDRQKVSDDMKQMLTEKVGAYGLVVDNLNVINFDFSEEFNKAIEAKQTAQQLALKAEQDLTRVKVEAEQKVAQAEAEARALKAQRQEITPDLLKLREIEATMKAIEKWNGQMPQYVGGSEGTIFNIPTK